VQTRRLLTAYNSWKGPMGVWLTYSYCSRRPADRPNASSVGKPSNCCFDQAACEHSQVCPLLLALQHCAQHVFHCLLVSTQEMLCFLPIALVG
jgi:hypothetical protein